MSNEENFEQAARRSYEGFMEDLKKWQTLSEAEEEWEEEKENDPEPDDYHTPEWDAWAKRDKARDTAHEQYREEIENDRDPLCITSRVEISIELSTGGPASGILLYANDGEVEEGYYWYQDWFKEKHRFSFSNSELDAVVEYYNIDADFYAPHQRQGRGW